MTSKEDYTVVSESEQWLVKIFTALPLIDYTSTVTGSGEQKITRYLPT
jgi:hypothetical protein